jgi:hypothetical protein
VADAPVVHIGENSPEEVAYKLLRHIAYVEDKIIASGGMGSGGTPADRAYILDTYAECLVAVTNPNYRLSKAKSS